MFSLESIPIKGLADKMTDKEFAEFCAANRDYQIERDKRGNILFSTPAHSATGLYEGETASALKVWSKQTKTGIAFSSSTGFKLPNTAIRSPDASWVSMEKWQSLTKAEKTSFAPICPEFVVEVRSKTDSLERVKEKMLEWIENGTLLGWLIDIANEKTLIYRADGSIEIIRGFDKILEGEDVLPGFTFDLNNLQLP